MEVVNSAKLWACSAAVAAAALGEGGEDALARAQEAQEAVTAAWGTQKYLSVSLCYDTTRMVLVDLVTLLVELGIEDPAKATLADLRRHTRFVEAVESILPVCDDWRFTPPDRLMKPSVRRGRGRCGAKVTVSSSKGGARRGCQWSEGLPGFAEADVTAEGSLAVKDFMSCPPAPARVHDLRRSQRHPRVEYAFYGTGCVAQDPHPSTPTGRLRGNLPKLHGSMQLTPVWTRTRPDVAQLFASLPHTAPRHRDPTAGPPSAVPLDTPLRRVVARARVRETFRRDIGHTNERLRRRSLLNDDGPPPVDKSREKSDELFLRVCCTADLNTLHIALTPLLHEAVRRGRVSLVCDLLDLLPDGSIAVDSVKDHSFRTPLHVAAVHGRTDLVGALAAGCTWVDLPDAQGRTAAQLALQHRHWATAEALFTAGAARWRCVREVGGMDAGQEALARRVVAEYLAHLGFDAWVAAGAGAAALVGRVQSTYTCRTSPPRGWSGFDPYPRDAFRRGGGYAPCALLGTGSVDSASELWLTIGQWGGVMRWSDNADAALFLLKHLVWFPQGDWVVTKATRAMREALKEQRQQATLVVALHCIMKRGLVDVAAGMIASPFYPSGAVGDAALVAFVNGLHMFYPRHTVERILALPPVQRVLPFNGLCPHRGFLLSVKRYFFHAANPFHRLVYKLSHLERQQRVRTQRVGSGSGAGGGGMLFPYARRDTVDGVTPPPYPFATTAYLEENFELFVAGRSGVHLGLHTSPPGPPVGKIYTFTPESVHGTFNNYVSDTEVVRRPFMSLYDMVTVDRALKAVTPLYVALRHGGVHLARVLLERGVAHANEVCCVARHCDPYGLLALRPLNVAVTAADVDAVACLLEFGADTALTQRVLHAPLPAPLHSLARDVDADIDADETAEGGLATELIGDIWLRICQYLPTKDVVRLGMTCWQLHETVAANEVWGERVKRGLYPAMRAALFASRVPVRPVQHRLLRGRGFHAKGFDIDNISNPAVSHASDESSSSSSSSCGSSELEVAERCFVAALRDVPGATLQYPAYIRAFLSLDAALRDGVDLVPGTEHGIVDLREVMRYNAALRGGDGAAGVVPNLPGFDSYKWGYYDVLAAGDRLRHADMAAALLLIARKVATAAHLASVATLYTAPAEATRQVVAYPLRWALAAQHTPLAHRLIELLLADVAVQKSLPVPLLGELVVLGTQGSGSSFTWQRVPRVAGESDYSAPFSIPWPDHRPSPEGDTELLPLGLGCLHRTLAASDNSCAKLLSHVINCLPDCEHPLTAYQARYGKSISWHIRPAPAAGQDYPLMQTDQRRADRLVPAHAYPLLCVYDHRDAKLAFRGEPQSTAELAVVAAACGRVDVLEAIAARAHAPAPSTAAVDIVRCSFADNVDGTQVDVPAAMRLGLHLARTCGRHHIAAGLIASTSGAHRITCRWYTIALTAVLYAARGDNAASTSNFAWCVLYEATLAAVAAGCEALVLELFAVRRGWLRGALCEASVLACDAAQAVANNVEYYFEALLQRGDWGGCSGAYTPYPLPPRFNIARARSHPCCSILVSAIQRDLPEVVRAVYDEAISTTQPTAMDWCAATCRHRGRAGGSAFASHTHGPTPLGTALKLAVALGSWRAACAVVATLDAHAAVLAPVDLGEPEWVDACSEGDDSDDDSDGEALTDGTLRRVTYFGEPLPWRWDVRPFAVLHDAAHARTRQRFSAITTVYDIFGPYPGGSVRRPYPLFPSPKAVWLARALLPPTLFTALTEAGCIVGRLRCAGAECLRNEQCKGTGTGADAAAAHQLVRLEDIFLKDLRGRHERAWRVAGARFAMLSRYYRKGRAPGVVLVVEPSEQGVDRLAMMLVAYGARHGEARYRAVPLPSVYLPRGGQAIDTPALLNTRRGGYGYDHWILCGVRRDPLFTTEAGAPVDCRFPDTAERAGSVEDCAGLTLGAVGVYSPDHREVFRDFRFVALSAADVVALDAAGGSGSAFRPRTMCSGPIDTPLQDGGGAAFYTLVVKVPPAVAVGRGLTNDEMRRIAENSLEI